MSVNELVDSLENLIKEESKVYNKGEMCYPYIAGYLLSTIKNLAIGLNPKKILAEEVENLKRRGHINK